MRQGFKDRALPSRKLQSNKDLMIRGGAVVIHKLHASGATPPPHHHMVSSLIHTPVPHFSKVSIMSLCSYERPRLVPIFCYLKDTQRGFSLLQK